MIRQIKMRKRKKEKLLDFRLQLIKIYEELKKKIEELCEEYGVEINFWYNPSKIPQPKFFFGKLGISADTLYNEENFNLLCSPKNTLNLKK